MAIRFQKKLKDRINRNHFCNNEKRLKYYKFMILKYKRFTRSNSTILRKRAIFYINRIQAKIQEMPKIKINNYCVLTGRSKGVYRDFKMSRHQIRYNFKYFTGLRNSSF